MQQEEMGCVQQEGFGLDIQKLPAWDVTSRSGDFLVAHLSALHVAHSLWPGDGEELKESRR
jgi:hypothetical protein